MNLGDVRDRVADMLARTDLNTQIEAEIALACRKYSRKPLHLMELRGGTITTVATQQWYDAMDLSAGAAYDDVTSRTSVPVRDILRIQYVRYSSSIYDALEYVPFETFQAVQDAASIGGNPYWYTRHSGRIGFWDVPNDSYEIEISAFIKPLIPTLAGDTSAWFDEAQELIEFTAAGAVAEKFMQDFERATRMKTFELGAYGDLVGESGLKTTTGRIKAHD